VLTGQGLLHDAGDWDHQLYRPLRAARGKWIAIKAISYCVWRDRGQERMKVWIDTVEPKWLTACRRCG